MKCEYCGGYIIEDQRDPFGSRKCIMCGREPKTKETKMNEDQKTKVCSKCKKPVVLTEEFFSHNHTTPDGWERFCKICASQMRKDRKEKIAGKNPGERKHGNNGGHARKKIHKKEIQIVRGSASIMNSEQLFRTFRYTLAYEICDEVVSHINQLKEKLASELQQSKV